MVLPGLKSGLLGLTKAASPIPCPARLPGPSGVFLQGTSGSGSSVPWIQSSRLYLTVSGSVTLQSICVVSTCLGVPSERLG